MRVTKDHIFMFRIVKKKSQRPVTLEEHFHRRNRILIKRRLGGVGDILAQRMMFEDVSKSFEGAELYYACPDNFLFFAGDHPYCHLLRLGDLNERCFGVVYDITTACAIHESKYGPHNTMNRSDIWAAVCGIELTNHKMYLKTDDQSKIDFYGQKLKSINPESKPIVLLAPHSLNDEFGIPKSMTDEQIRGVVNYLRNTGHLVVSMHNRNLDILDELGVYQFVNVSYDEWLYIVWLVDYVISVDTGTFHMAGGLGKPMVAFFTFVDGLVYSKYYDCVLVQKHRDSGGWDCGPCYILTCCPKSDELRKPCCTEVEAQSIIDGFEMLKSQKSGRILLKSFS